MAKTKQLRIFVVALVLGYWAGNQDRAASVQIDAAHVDVQEVAWSIGSGGKGWSDMFM